MVTKKEHANPLQRLEALHQCIGVIIGSSNEVKHVTSYHAQS
jgi:hypothetical protein